jgi:4-aminobutyrate aminotransferase-like enzyme
VKVPFGDIAALEAAIKSDPEIGVVVLETIQGGAGIVEAPASYWQGKSARSATSTACSGSPTRSSAAWAAAAASTPSSMRASCPT